MSLWQGIASIMAVVLLVNIAVLAALVRVWHREKCLPKLSVLQGGTRRRRPVPHRDRSRA